MYMRGVLLRSRPEILNPDWWVQVEVEAEAVVVLPPMCMPAMAVLVVSEAATG
jgi:hypothetical protein